MPATALSDESSGHPATPVREVERTLEIASTAIAKMKALAVEPNPHNFALWYAYATRSDAKLNQRIDDLLERNIALTTRDLENLASEYILSYPSSQLVEHLGDAIGDKLASAASLVAQASSDNLKVEDQLSGASHDLTEITEAGALLACVQRLAGANREFWNYSRKLSDNLRSKADELTALQKDLNRIQAEGQTDGLTALWNRKYFDGCVDRAIANCLNHDEPFSVLMLDLDHFKSFNDRFGHLTGDQVLRFTAESIRRNIKGRDVAARFGGEEFAVMLSSASLYQSMAVGDTIRRTIASALLKKKSTNEALGQITISIGVAQWRAGETRDILVERADLRLYEAKHGGRNRVAG